MDETSGKIRLILVLHDQQKEIDMPCVEGPFTLSRNVCRSDVASVGVCHQDSLEMAITFDLVSPFCFPLAIAFWSNELREVK